MVNQLLEVFRKRNCKKLVNEEVLKRKGENCMSNGKDAIIHLIVGLIKKTYKNDLILF